MAYQTKLQSKAESNHTSSDSEITIDDSFLTSEPDCNDVNSIQRMAEIATAIGKKLGYKSRKNGFNVAHQSSLYAQIEIWPPNAPYSEDLVSNFMRNASPISAMQELNTPAGIGGRALGPGEIVGRNKLDDAHYIRSKEFRVHKTKQTHRSKQGCWTCRLRHKACPEDGDPCGACARLGLECDVSRRRPGYMVNTKNAAERLKEIRAVTDKLRKRSRSARQIPPNL